MQRENLWWWYLMVVWWLVMIMVGFSLIVKNLGNPGKIKWSGKVKELFCFSKKSGNIIVKFKKVIFIWNMIMLWLWFHALAKMSHQMLKIVREICVQVREEVRESQRTFSRFWLGTLCGCVSRVDILTNTRYDGMDTQVVLSSHCTGTCLKKYTHPNSLLKFNSFQALVMVH